MEDSDLFFLLMLYHHGMVKMEMRNTLPKNLTRMQGLSGIAAMAPHQNFQQIDFLSDGNPQDFSEFNESHLHQSRGYLNWLFIPCDSKDTSALHSQMALVWASKDVGLEWSEEEV